VLPALDPLTIAGAPASPSRPATRPCEPLPFDCTWISSCAGDPCRESEPWNDIRFVQALLSARAGGRAREDDFCSVSRHTDNLYAPAARERITASRALVSALSGNRCRTCLSNVSQQATLVDRNERTTLDQALVLANPIIRSRMIRVALAGAGRVTARLRSVIQGGVMYIGGGLLVLILLVVVVMLMMRGRSA
jgi:hypothetical protein